MTTTQVAMMMAAEQQRHQEIIKLLSDLANAKPEKLEQAADVLPRMWTLKEAAEQTGLSYDYLRKLCVRGKLTHIKAGCKILINADKLTAYLNQGEPAAGV